MVIVFLHGGLGNQMFQYAMARRLAYVRGVELKLDLSDYAGETNRQRGLESFSRKMRLYELSVTAPAATMEEIVKFRDPYHGNSTKARIVRQLRKLKPGWLWPPTDVREIHYRFDPAMLELNGDVYLFGFWQSPKYFADAAEIIRADFKPKDPAVTAYAGQYVNRLRDMGGPIVSVHVRRGDLAYASERLGVENLVHGRPVGNDYLTAAMGRFPPESRFLVFSDSADDIAWCKANVRADRLHFSEGHNDVQDLAIMSACDHHVIANSTYSWWAAWLNQRPGRRVVTPRTWSNSDAAFKIVTDDLIPADWEMI